MTARVLDGTRIADEIRRDLAGDVQKWGKVVRDNAIKLD